MRGLTVLYDETCGFCVRCAGWVAGQPAYVPVRFLPAGSAEAAKRYPGVKGDRAMELVAVDTHGGVYRDTDALLLILWALREYREWSLRLATPALKPWTRAIFWRLSKGRHALSRWLGWDRTEATFREAAQAPPPTCVDGSCRIHAKTCPRCHAPLTGTGNVCARCLARVMRDEASAADAM